MLKQYAMKDLGYKRTPTNAMMRVQMTDGSWWAVPVQVIADNRDEYYANEQEDTIGFILDESLDEYEIKDWAANNMNWEDVSTYAAKVLDPPPSFVDFDEGWSNGEKEIVGLR